MSDIIILNIWFVTTVIINVSRPTCEFYLLNSIMYYQTFCSFLNKIFKLITLFLRLKICSVYKCCHSVTMFLQPSTPDTAGIKFADFKQSGVTLRSQRV